ncbi:YicC family protein [Flavipsychrobacter stenotrophus]|uniref:YicC family protein n=1 Tax=Flavipsychrobacter stenotrophus TaxID=2077091 RepID=A0A2S7SYF9_9BACT|nr:YicC/YloC family endoribonuclease [Flavipsychrobacter stenotrophus]PQJ11738.1 YicC family protein [Flavipsychrobacter stenotrophus]
MLYSMTGFGRADAAIGNRQVVVEMKALNGKQFELMTKLPPILRNYELDIRNLLNSALMRGTIDVTITVKQEGASKPMVVNTDLAMFYYQGMKQIAEQVGIPTDNIISTLMRMPEVVAPDQDALAVEDWEKVKIVVEKAAANLMEHRRHEGEVLYKDIHSRISNIEQLLEKVIPLEGERTTRVRAKIEQWLIDVVGKQKIDENRLEQEMIYYLERMDISEEKTRLKQHCVYFHETVDNKDTAIGRKLNFILQEIGREVNTLGSKANHAEIQQIVINMKDELEKAKEQILNIL